MRRGFALLMSLIILLLVSTIAVVILRVLNSSYYFSQGEVTRIENYYVVQAAKEYFLSNMSFNLRDPRIDYGAASPSTPGVVHSGNYVIGIFNYRTATNDIQVDVSVDNATSSGETYVPDPSHRIQQIRAGR